MLPFVILFVANFGVLLSWTLVAPLRWTRVEVANFDQFGRSVESYGTCFSPSGSSSRQVSSRNAFLVALAVFNFVAVVLANYQCYLSRHSPSDFNESYYIGLSMLSILEGYLLGIPILVLTIGKPTAQYVVSSILIFLLCMAIAVPTFVGKLFAKQRSPELRIHEWKRAWRNYDESTSTRRFGHNSSGGSSSRGGSAGDSAQLSSVAAIRARAAASAQGGSSSSRDFSRRASTPADTQLSSVAAIRARVAEKALSQREVH